VLIMTATGPPGAVPDPDALVPNVRHDLHDVHLGSTCHPCGCMTAASWSLS